MCAVTSKRLLHAANQGSPRQRLRASRSIRSVQYEKAAIAQLRTFAGRVKCRFMVELTYLAPGERLPELPDDEPWLTVEASCDGRFFGTGYGR